MRTKGQLGIFAIALVVAALGTATASYAQSDFPNRRIHVILPYPAGGIVDIVTRVVTDKLAADWGQPIVIEPKPGANGNLAWAQVARAEPDGYTWAFFGPGVIANPRMQPSVKWNEDSFVVIGGVVWAPSVIVVNPSVPANTVAEFIAHAKTRPAQALLALRPAGSLSRPRRPLSRGFAPAGYPTEPLVSFRTYRQLSGWNPPPLMIRAVRAHCQNRSSASH